MFLKKYQVKVVSELKAFYGKARETQDAFDTARKALPAEMRHTLNWVQTTFQTAVKEYKDRCTNRLSEYYPRVIMKVPTGGGKTLLAVEAIREYQNLFARKRTGLELKDEDMVKLDMHIIPPSVRKEDDWKSMLREIKAHRDTLKKKAITYRQNTGTLLPKRHFGRAGTVPLHICLALSRTSIPIPALPNLLGVSYASPSPEKQA